MPASVIIAVLIGVGGAVWLSERLVQRRVLKRMRDRPSRTPEEFGRDLFPRESALIARRTREILGRHLTIDLSRLSPEDTLADLEMAELD